MEGLVVPVFVVCVMAIHSSTSDTTRQPRSGEVNGRGLCTIVELCSVSLCTCLFVANVHFERCLINFVTLLFCTYVIIEYHFTSKDAMLKSIANGDFIEHAEFSGNIYGTRCACTIGQSAVNMYIPLSGNHVI